MKFAQSVILLSLLSIFFLGNIGVNVFKHICQKDGVSISYIVDRGEEQCGNHHEQTDLPPCCQKHNDEDKDDCCDDEVVYYKLQTDVEQHAAFNFQLQATLSEEPAIFYAEVLPQLQEHNQTNFEDPPPLCGKEILIRKQVWNL